MAKRQRPETRPTAKAQPRTLAEKYQGETLLFVPVDLLGDPAVGKRLRWHRYRLGLSQEAVAKSAGLSQTDISRIEANPANSRIVDLIAVCRALNVSIGDLIEGEIRSLDPDTARSTGRAV